MENSFTLVPAVNRGAPRVLIRMKYRNILIIMGLALVIRVAWALLAPHLDPLQINNQLPGDASGYDLLATNLLHGFGFTWDGVQPTSYRMPGYPVFLAGAYALFGHNLTAVRLIQAILGALLCLPVYHIARNFGGERTAILASLAIALYPTLIYLGGWVYSETLYILLLWLGLWVLLIAVTRGQSYLSYRGSGLSLAAGGLWGLATFVRPETLLLPFAMAAFVWIAKLIGVLGESKVEWKIIRRPLSSILLVQIVLVAILAPWAIRNSRVNQAFVPLTTSAGSNLYAGNNPESNGGSAWVMPLPGMSEYASDQRLGRQARQWIRENPLAAAKNESLKFVRFFSPFEFETRGNPFGRLGLFVNAAYALFLVLAAYGAHRSWHQTNGLVCLYPLLLLSLISWYLMTALVFFGGSRVALPVVPSILIFASFGTFQIINRTQIKT